MFYNWQLTSQNIGPVTSCSQLTTPGPVPQPFSGMAFRFYQISAYISYLFFDNNYSKVYRRNFAYQCFEVTSSS